MYQDNRNTERWNNKKKKKKKKKKKMKKLVHMKNI